MSDPAEVFKDQTEEEDQGLWAAEAQSRLDEYRAGRANAVPAEELVRKAERLFR